MLLADKFEASEARDRKTQLDLLELNRLRLTPATPTGVWREDVRRLSALTLMEGAFLEALRDLVADEAAVVPTKPRHFTNWFTQLERTAPGQHDDLFPWLAERASLDQMKWFLAQEVVGEAGFEDLTALTQVRLSSQPKLEMARNYWDEMGRVNLKVCTDRSFSGFRRR